jgi:hypothetical protein
MPRLRVLLFLALIAGLASMPLFAKGATTKITIESPRFSRPIEIADPAIIKEFQAFAGLGNTIGFGPGAPPAPSAQQNSMIVYWSRGTVAPPSELERS